VDFIIDLLILVMMIYGT
jgi:hypothetical protein